MDVIELVKKAKAGDSQAFGRLYDEFADRIFKFIRFKVQNQQQAEDILQETFVKAWRGLPDLKIEGVNFSAWLYRIAANTITDYYRKVYRSPAALELDENFPLETSERADSGIIHEQNSEVVRRALKQLPIGYRQVLELRFLQEFTPAETAKILGKSNLSIRITQHRALKKLKLIMHEFYDLGFEKI